MPGFVKIVAVVCLVFGIFCVLSGLLLLTQNDPGGTALLIVLGALLIGLFVWLRRRRVVLGPDGIDVRELLGSTHVPWPDSRGALIAFEGSRTSTRSTAVAQLRPADGSRPVRLGTITASAGDAQTAQLRVSEQLDDIWAWATAMGYVRPASTPAWGAAASASSSYGIVPPGADSYGIVPPSAAPAAPRPGLSLADPAALSRDSLTYRAWPGNWVAVVILGGFGALMIAGVLAGLDGITGILAIALGVFLLGSAAVLALSRTVVDRSGIHTRLGLTRHHPWPASRQQLVEVIVYNSGRKSTTAARIVDPDGRASGLPGVVGTASATSGAELDLVRSLDTIWSWGEQHGVARESGQYIVAAKADVEGSRRSAAERVAYLRSRRP